MWVFKRLCLAVVILSTVGCGGGAGNADDRSSAQIGTRAVAKFVLAFQNGTGDNVLLTKTAGQTWLGTWRGYGVEIMDEPQGGGKTNVRMFLHMLPSNEFQFVFPNFTKAEIGMRTVTSSVYSDQVLVNGRTIVNLVNGAIVCSPFSG